MSVAKIKKSDFVFKLRSACHAYPLIGSVCVRENRMSVVASRILRVPVNVVQEQTNPCLTIDDTTRCNQLAKMKQIMHTVYHTLLIITKQNAKAKFKELPPHWDTFQF